MAEPNVMLVEGVDEWNFFNDLLRNSSLGPSLEIKRKKVPRPSALGVSSSKTLLQFAEMDGIERLLDFLSQELRSHNPQRMGIVIDADDNITGRWTRLKEILTQRGYQDIPDKPHAVGVIVENTDQQRVGIWIMPDNAGPGMLEDFIAALISPDDKLLPEAKKSVENAMAVEQRFVSEHRSKALIHTWLAWQEYPGTSLGLTSTRKYLNTKSPRMEDFLDWIRRLFDIIPAA